MALVDVRGVARHAAAPVAGVVGDEGMNGARPLAAAGGLRIGAGVKHRGRLQPARSVAKTHEG
jgi:hypothetical protein